MSDTIQKAVNFLTARARWSELDKLQELDLGIASVVFALYAFGCFPITSCRGHPPPTAGYRHPLVAFYPRPERAPMIVGVAAGSGVGICNEWAESNSALMVFASNIIDMQKFAIGLHRAFSTVAVSRAQNSHLTPETINCTTSTALPNNNTKLNRWLV